MRIDIIEVPMHWSTIQRGITLCSFSFNLVSIQISNKIVLYVLIYGYVEIQSYLSVPREGKARYPEPSIGHRGENLRLTKRDEMLSTWMLRLAAPFNKL